MELEKNILQEKIFQELLDSCLKNWVEEKKFPVFHIKEFVAKISGLGNFASEDFRQICFELIKNSLEVGVMEEYLFSLKENKEELEFKEILENYRENIFENTKKIYDLSSELNKSLFLNQFDFLEEKDRGVFSYLRELVEEQEKEELISLMEENIVLNSFFKNLLRMPLEFHQKNVIFYDKQFLDPIRKKVIDFYKAVSLIR